jgi:hypothetical protein
VKTVSDYCPKYHSVSSQFSRLATGVPVGHADAENSIPIGDGCSILNNGGSGEALPTPTPGVPNELFGVEFAGRSLKNNLGVSVSPFFAARRVESLPILMFSNLVLMGGGESLLFSRLVSMGGGVLERGDGAAITVVWCTGA